MKIKQWEDKTLAQFSYGIVDDDNRNIILIDPSRNPDPYMRWAAEENATITGIIETHPHADFISGHKELREKTGATIYAHSLAGAQYDHETLDEGTSIRLGKLMFISLHTPGHSPDSISIVLEHDGKQKAVFTGDTLFINDCGRPDLREGAGNIHATKTDLAKQMFHSLREKLMKLDDDVIVYPAHGAGTLCGKNISKESSSTMAHEKKHNWCLQETTEDQFVKDLLADQPFVPHYFPYDVELNRVGAEALGESLSKVKRTIIDEQEASRLDHSIWIVDGRDEKIYKAGHLPHSVNIMQDGKFETWLGSIIKPSEQFYLVAEDEQQLQRMMERAAAIGYESLIQEAFVYKGVHDKVNSFDVDAFAAAPGKYTIVDVRNTSETKTNRPFDESLNIPLAELRERMDEIPTHRPVVVHCAGGYRSAAGSSMIDAVLGGKTKVHDLGEKINRFTKGQ